MNFVRTSDPHRILMYGTDPLLQILEPETKCMFRVSLRHGTRNTASRIFDGVRYFCVGPGPPQPFPLNGYGLDDFQFRLAHTSWGRLGMSFECLESLECH
jgi:hypothetical protein